MRARLDEETGEIIGPQGGDEFSAPRLQRLLRELYDLRRQRDSLDAVYKKAVAPVRKWLEDHPAERLYDGETGIYAALQERLGSPTLDTMSLAQREPGLVLWLAEKGALKLNVAAWNALNGQAAETLDIKRYLYRSGASRALIIDKEK